MIQMKMLMLWA